MDFQQRFMSLQATLNTAVESYNELQKELPKLQKTRQQFTQQQHENEMVLKELELVVDDAAVYKMIGPALVKQDLDEAKANVKKRLGFIGDELKRLDTKLGEVEAKITKRQGQIMQLQQEGTRMQQAAQQAAAAAQGAG